MAGVTSKCMLRQLYSSQFISIVSVRAKHIKGFIQHGTWYSSPKCLSLTCKSQAWCSLPTCNISAMAYASSDDRLTPQVLMIG